MSPEVSHDLECASAAYAILIERAEGRGNRAQARSLRREWQNYLKEREAKR